MDKIRVMIVEDSSVIRQLLEHIIAGDPRLTAVACVESAEAALNCMSRVAPDVISMDIHLPGMNGFEATRRIMETQPTPIVIVSGSLHDQDLQNSMKALKSGALAVVEKPVGATHDDYEAFAERLCTQLAIMSQVKVVRQRFNSRRRSAPGGTMQTTRDCENSGWDRSRPVSMIGVVSSTGGPRALQMVFRALPADFPVPIVLVQHITANFHLGFVQWLDQTCPLSVVTAKHGQTAVGGHVYVAPPDFHLHVNGSRLMLNPGAPVSAQRPSGTVLLDSMAATLNDRSLGVVLTGMGDDGAAGLLSIRRAGGYTLAEDESTAVVFGMPAAAARLGAVCELLPLQEIGPQLFSLVQRTAEVN